MAGYGRECPKTTSKYSIRLDSSCLTAWVHWFIWAEPSLPTQLHWPRVYSTQLFSSTPKFRSAHKIAQSQEAFHMTTPKPSHVSMATISLPCHHPASTTQLSKVYLFCSINLFLKPRSGHDPNQIYVTQTSQLSTRNLCPKIWICMVDSLLSPDLNSRC